MAEPGAEMIYLLDALGRHASEKVSVSSMRNGEFKTIITTVGKLPGQVAAMSKYDVWYGTGVLRPDLTSGRGLAIDVVGVRELFADLDVKPGGLPSWDAARDAISDLSDILNDKPAAVVNTGHGLQPHWKIERGSSTDWKDHHDPRWLKATALFRQWGRMVAHVAEKHGGSVDNVFDLSRVLRCPGTSNVDKNPDAPLRTALEIGSET